MINKEIPYKKCKNCKYVNVRVNGAICSIPFYKIWKFINNADDEMRDKEIYQGIKIDLEKYVDLDKIDEFMKRTGLKAKNYNNDMRSSNMTYYEFSLNRNNNCPIYQEKILAKVTNILKRGK